MKKRVQPPHGAQPQHYVEPAAVEDAATEDAAPEKKTRKKKEEPAATGIGSDAFTMKPAAPAAETEKVEESTEVSDTLEK